MLWVNLVGKIGVKYLVNSQLVSNFASFFGLYADSATVKLLKDSQVGVRQVCVITKVITTTKV